MGWDKAIEYPMGDKKIMVKRKWGSKRVRFAEFNYIKNHGCKETYRQMRVRNLKEYRVYCGTNTLYPPLSMHKRIMERIEKW